MTAATTPDAGGPPHDWAFEDLLVGVLDQAYGTALRLTGSVPEAEDLVQEAALLAQRGFPGFRPGSNFRAWFYRILLNRFYSDHRRRRRAPPVVSLDAKPEGEHHASVRQALADPASDLLDRLDADLIDRALDALPDDYRAAAVLYFMQDMPYQEIAEVLDVPLGTVRSRLHRARRQLQRSLLSLAREHGLGTSQAPREDA